MAVDMRITLDETEVLEEIKDAIGLGKMFDYLDFAETEILEHFSIEDLVKQAYAENPGQVKENLCAIMDIKEEIIIPGPSIETYLIKVVKDHGLLYIMESLKSVLRDKVTILWEEK